MTKKKDLIAIFGAMPQEIEAYNSLIKKYKNLDLRVFLTGIGKPTAAANVQKVISEYNPKIIIFSGVAGSLNNSLRIGDICIGYASIDSDLDLKSLDKSYLRGEQFISRERLYFSDKKLVDIAKSTKGIEIKDSFIATGSAFLDWVGKKRFLKEINPLLKAKINNVEQIPDVYDIESSAILQTTKANKVPALIIRVISDDLMGNSAKDFNKFIKQSVKNYLPVVQNILEYYSLNKI